MLSQCHLSIGMQVSLCILFQIFKVFFLLKLHLAEFKFQVMTNKNQLNFAFLRICCRPTEFATMVGMVQLEQDLCAQMEPCLTNTNLLANSGIR